MNLPISFPDILALIPQAPPFVFVDQLIKADNCGAKVCYLPSATVPFFKDDRVSAEIVLEMMAQTGALHQGYMALLQGHPKPKGYIATVDKARFENLPRVGKPIEIQFHLRSVHGQIAVAEAHVHQDGKWCAEAVFKIFRAEGSPS